MEDTIQSLATSMPILGTFVAMILNGVLNFPSSQILYPLLGAYLGKAGIATLPVIVAGSLGNAIGNIILYELTRKYGRSFVGKYEGSLQSLESWMHKQKPIYHVALLMIAKLVPALKSVVPLYAGLVALGRVWAYSVFFVASFVWAYLLVTFGEMLSHIFSWPVFILYTVVISSLVYYFTARPKEKTKVSNSLS